MKVLKPTITIVDDDNDYAKLLEKFLKLNDFNEVYIFNDGISFLNSLNNLTSEIIIIDYDLPDMNGLNIYQKIKNDYPSINFIFLSGQENINIVLEAINSGAFAYIIKDEKAFKNLLVKLDNIISLKKNILRYHNLKKNLIISLFIFLFIWIIFVLLIIKKEIN